MLKRVFLTALSVCFLFAQSDRGTITGRVLDPSSAVVPNAKIEAVNQATRVKYQAATSDAGVYSIQQLPVGRYDVTAEAAGFSRYLHKDVDVSVAQTITLNVTLAVGGVDQTVEVTARGRRGRSQHLGRRHRRQPRHGHGPPAFGLRQHAQPGELHLPRAGRHG